MNDSFPVFRLFGIDVRLHVLFIYLVGFLLFLGAQNGNAGGVAIVLTMLFGLVLLHELGHSLVARHFGIHVIDIVLWPLGGMARMAEIPENSRIEGWVAIAGPLVNLGLGLPALALHLLVFGPETLLSNPLARPIDSFEDLLAGFVWVNGMLGIFNLVPAFPMDGGRLLRAWFARNDGWLLATEKAVRVGRYVAWTMILSVFAPVSVSCSLPIIGLFILWTGARELWATRMRHAAAGGAFTLADLFRRAGEAGAPPHGPSPNDPGSGPVIDIEVPRAGAGRSGFSDEDIARLERFPGRLNPPRREGESGG